MYKNHLLRSISLFSLCALTAPAQAAEKPELTVPAPVVHESIVANGGTDTYGFIEDVSNNGDAAATEALIEETATPNEAQPTTSALETEAKGSAAAVDPAPATQEAVFAKEQVHTGATTVTAVAEAAGTPGAPKAAVVATQTTNSPFHGWFAGLSTGMSYENDVLKGEELNYMGHTLINKGNVKIFAPFIRGELGKSFVINDFYWSLSFGLEANFARRQKTLPLKNITRTNEEDTITKYRWHKDSTYAITQKFGWCFDHDNILYLKIGALNSNFRLHYKQRNAEENKRKNLWGAEIGAGWLTSIDENWSFHMDYGYQIYTSFDYDFDADPLVNRISKISPRFHVVTLGIQYKF